MEKSNSINECQTCNSSRHIKRHVLGEHLPWYVNPTVACVDCHRAKSSKQSKFHTDHQSICGESLLQAWFLLINGIFHFVIRELCLDSFADLLMFVVDRGLCPNRIQFSEEEIVFLREYDMRAGLEPLSADQYQSFPPSRICVLTHFQLLQRITPFLSSTAQSRFPYLNEYRQFDGSYPPIGHPRMRIAIIDTHFHLDKLSSCLRKSFVQLESSESIEVRLPYAIANYVYPSNWDKIRSQVGSNPNLKITLGVHPHMLLRQSVEGVLGHLCALIDSFPDLVGIGEVGLDFTARCTCGCTDKRTCRDNRIWAQRWFLPRIIRVAQRAQKTLVLHVRDKGDGSAAKEVLGLLQELNLTHLPIHRHCFVGVDGELEQWRTELPNCYFGLTAASLRHDSTVASLLSVGQPDKFILESDAPYLPMDKSSTKYDTPWNIGRVADKAASIIGCSLSQLVVKSNQNAAQLYGLNWT